MTELLFSDKAKHYLFAGRNPQETFLFTVTSSEVNVVMRLQIPSVISDSMLVMQATQLGDEGGTFLLKPILMTTSEQETVPPPIMIANFIKDVIEKTEQIQTYSKDRQEPPAPILDYVRNNLMTTLENIENN